MSIVNYLKRVWGGFKKSKVAAVIDAFVKAFTENVDDMLIAAAKKGVDIAKSTEGEWNVKLLAAVNAAATELGDQAATYAKTDIINAVQAVYTSEKI